MSVAKNIEISSTSSKGFDDAIRSGIKRASQTIKNIRGAWIKDTKVNVTDGEITEFSVTMIVTFILEDAQAG